jgi:hypothetical protein
VNRWFGAAIIVAVLTVAILVAGPSWLLTACDSPDPAIQDCGVVSAFLVGFVGALLAVGCVLIGVSNSSR